MQSSLQNTYAVNFNMPPQVTGLRTGRVTSPFDPRKEDEREDYKKYIARCLKTWTVDVLLDSGAYLTGVRVLQVQGNGREGLRRMPRFPRFIPDQEVELGDEVVVAFLHEQPLAPIIMGTLAPSRNPRADYERLEKEYAVTKDENEWQDRHDYLDTTKPKTLGSHTSTRDTGLTRDIEHVVNTWVDDVERRSHVLHRDSKARSLEYEHYVETGDGTAASVRTTDEEGVTLRVLHAVKDETATGKLSLESLQAQVASLQLEVENMGKLLVRATQGKQLLVQQTTPASTFTLAVSNPNKTASVTLQDTDAGTFSGLTLTAKGTTSLKRLSQEQKVSEVLLSDDGSVLVRSTEGSALLLDDGDVLLTSAGSTIQVTDDRGVSIATSGGSEMMLQDDALVVTAPAVTITAPIIHLSGQTVVGSGRPQGLSGLVPDTQTLYRKLTRLTDYVTTLYTWAVAHTHISTAPGSPTAPALPIAPPPTIFGAEFTASVLPDSLKSFRGE